MLNLQTLGRLALETVDGTSLTAVLSQPRRLALLVYLAAARPRGPHQRHALLPVFWAEADEASARHALHQALYWLRQRRIPGGPRALRRRRHLSGAPGLRVRPDGRNRGCTDDSAELIQQYQAGLPSPYYVAWTYFGLGERDSALRWLETTYDEGWGQIVYLLANPVWQSLRSEPRFEALVRKVGFA